MLSAKQRTITSHLMDTIRLLVWPELSLTIFAKGISHFFDTNCVFIWNSSFLNWVTAHPLLYSTVKQEVFLTEWLLLELSFILDSFHYSCLSSSLSISDCHPECLLSLSPSFMSFLRRIIWWRNHGADWIKVKDMTLGLTGDRSPSWHESILCLTVVQRRDGVFYVST